MVLLVLMLDIVVVVSVIIDFDVVVNDDDISVFFFRTTTTTIPCHTVFNTTLPHLSNYIPPVPLNSNNSTLIEHFRSITLITLYHTSFILIYPSHTTLHISLYPALPRPPHTTPSKIQKVIKNTNENKNKNTLVNYINSIFHCIGTI